MAGTANTLGGYEIVREIARSNDIVYEARDLEMNRRVALKELSLPPNIVGEQRRERITRFYREARAAGNLSHPNIVTIFKVGEDHGRYFIAMEFLEGDTLRNTLQIGGPLSIQKAIQVCAEILDALEYAHQHGVVHRDIKPDNIQILPSGVAKLTDFGIARMQTEPGITQAGQVFGTPSYMSPEQITGKPVDRRTDIFSMGVVLYEALTGRKPFTGDSIVTITYNIMNMEPEPPPGVPPHLQSIIRRAIAKSPDQRFNTASEMALALRSPAPANQTGVFGATRHVTSMPRVTPITNSGYSPPAGNTGGFPAANTGYSYPPASGYPSGPAQPVDPAAAAPGTGPQAYPSGIGANSGQMYRQAVPGYPGSALPNIAPPLPRTNPPLVSVLRFLREFFIRQSMILNLLGLVVVFFLIAVLLAWALAVGYQRSRSPAGAPPATTSSATTENQAQAANLQKQNDTATALLDSGQFRQAYNILQPIQDQAASNSPLGEAIQHNLGIYWLEAARDARTHKDWQTAHNDYSKALALVPDEQDMINQEDHAVQLAMSASPQPGGLTPSSESSPSPPAPASSSPASVSSTQTPSTTSTLPTTPTANPAPAVSPSDSPGLIASRAAYDAGLKALDEGNKAQASASFKKVLSGDPSAPWFYDATERLLSLNTPPASDSSLPGE